MGTRVLAFLAVRLSLLLGLAILTGCERQADSPVVGVAFDTLQTEYWVASLGALDAALGKHGMTMHQVIADNDAIRQQEQIKTLITKKVAAIIVAPKDAEAVLPMIKAANQANIPIVLYNRPPAREVGKSVTIVADNKKITRDTVEYMVAQARKTGKKHKALLLVGDLGDVNAINRRDGFLETVAKHPDVIDPEVIKVPTDWNQEKALAGVTAALQGNPDISFIFSSSDFLFPSVVSALKAANKYHKIGAAGHVILGGFDGDATAYQMLVDGYLDADGVQDVYFECDQAVQAALDQRAGKPVPAIIPDPGFVIHQGNLKEMAPRMWGAQVQKKS